MAIQSFAEWKQSKVTPAVQSFDDWRNSKKEVVPYLISKFVSSAMKNSTVGMADKYAPTAVENIKSNLKALSTPEGARTWQEGFPETPLGDVLRYFANWYIAPAAQIPYAAKETFGKGKTAGERARGGLQLAGNLASTLLPGLEDIVYTGAAGLKGYSKASLEGKAGKERLLATKRAFTGQDIVPLGEALVKEPGTTQTALNWAELPLALMAGKAIYGKGALKNIDAKTLGMAADELSMFKTYDELLGAARTGWKPGETVSKLLTKGMSLRELFNEVNQLTLPKEVNAPAELKRVAEAKIQQARAELPTGTGKGLEGTPLGREVEAEQYGGGLFAEKPTKAPALDETDVLLDKAKLMSEDVANTDLDEVRGLIYSNDIVTAHKKWSAIEHPNKPDFLDLEKEVVDFQAMEIAESTKAVGDVYGAYQKDYNRIKSKVKTVGESTSKKAGELYREHVPEGTKGEMSSDELAGALGMTENELMSKVTDELLKSGEGVDGGGRAPAKPTTVSRGQQIRHTVPRTSISRGEIPVAPGQEIMPETVMTYHAEPTAETLKKIEGRQTTANTKTREKAAQESFAEWQKQVFAQETNLPTTPGKQAQVIGKMMGEATTQNAPLTRNIEELKDLSWGGKKTLDTTRVFERVYGKRFADVDRIILKPWDEAKEAMRINTDNYLNQLNENVVKPLGGRKSKESAAIQKFGENLVTKDDLIKEFGQEKANKIIAADQWFRKIYDETLDATNKVLEAIYPNNLEKRIQKRTDYYRHFAELSGFGGLKKALQDTELGEAPSVVPMGVSKPKAKWLSVAKKRLGSKTEYDAVGGFIDYIPQAEYMIHINPQVSKFRDLAKELAELTNDIKKPATYGKLNRFIDWLNNEAGHLTGEPNIYDVSLTKGFIDNPRVMRVLDWTNRRVKANVMLGNLGASVVQSANMVQGAAKAGLKNFIAGMGDLVFAPIKGELAAVSDSLFLKERYSYKTFRKFDVGLLEKSRDFGAWLTTVLDEFGTKTNWNAMYRKALELGVDDPIRYADLETGKLVGHRGIGATSELQRSMTTQFIAPFQLEVTNNWHVMKDMVNEKAYGNLVKFLVYSWIYNGAVEKVIGRKPLFDPIDAIGDAYTLYSDEPDKKKGALKAVGRLSGEVLSNVPFGQTLTSMAITSPETRKEFFGEEDPTRFGGGLVASKALTDPLFTVLNPLGFGGTQIKRTIESATALIRGYSKTASGDMRFPVSSDVDNVFQILFMGQYATPTARFYFKENLRPLSEAQLKQWQTRVKGGQSPEVAWANLYKIRLANGLPEKYGQINKEKISAEEKAKKRAQVKKRYDELRQKLNDFGAGNEGFGLDDLLKLINRGEPEITPTTTTPTNFSSYTPTTGIKSFEEWRATRGQ